MTVGAAGDLRGRSSELIRASSKTLTLHLLRDPSVLFVIEGRKHADVIDADRLAHLGRSIEADQLLPDVGYPVPTSGVFGYSEAVATGGPIDVHRQLSSAAGVGG